MGCNNIFVLLLLYFRIEGGGKAVRYSMSCTSRLSSSRRTIRRRPSDYGVASASRVGWFSWALLPVLLLLLLEDPSARTPRTANGFVILPKDPRVLLSRRPHSNDARMDADTTTTTTTEACKDELLSLVQSAPSGLPTPRDLTNQILDRVQQLERQCPTPDDQINRGLQGTWELLWTAQDPRSPETRQAWASWINPLENQAYSNNPDASQQQQQGRANPFLPVGMQERLERAGLVAPASPVRSTQSIDVERGLIRNIVALDLGPRRASLTVTVRFTPDSRDFRRVNVKFDACKVNVPGTPIRQWNFPLGPLGPTGWLRTVYLDDTLRVTRGHKGSVFVLTRQQQRGSKTAVNNET